jgi:hypothetical protein
MLFLFDFEEHQKRDHHMNIFVLDFCVTLIIMSFNIDAACNTFGRVSGAPVVEFIPDTTVFT